MALFETPLKEIHLSLGARMVPFAGWNLPVQFPTGILEEHRHTRQFVSLFDTCHMGELRVFGEGAAASLDRLLVRPISDLEIGRCRYNLLMDDSGGIRDDLVLYRMAEEEYYLVVNAGPREEDAEWIRTHLPPSVQCRDESFQTGKIDLQGPFSAEILTRLGLSKKILPPYYRWTETELLGERILLSRTGYTGELGFEIYLPWGKTPLLWERLLREDEVAPAGLGARDTLRLEMGFPLYGHEISLDTTPVEAGFAPLLPREDSFVGDRFLTVPPRKRLIGIRLEGRRAARGDDPVMDAGGRRMGRVTSGSFAPSLDRAVALSYIDEQEKPSPGTMILVGDPKKPLIAEIAELPFYREGTARTKLSGEVDS
jgi:aminomethyltransferase